MQVCERLIGPAPMLGPICGMNAKAAYLWARPSKWRSAGDVTGAAHMRRLLDHSDRHGLGLTAVHLIRGAPEEEIAAILAARGAGTLEAAE